MKSFYLKSLLVFLLCSRSGFSPGHLGVRVPYALHYEPYALISALRFKYVALRVARVVRVQALEILCARAFST